MADTSRKRRRLDPVEVCQSAYDVIRNFKKEDGTLLCEAFIRAPKRRQEPAYFEVVSNPIDLLRIQQKIRTDEYEDLESMTEDVELLVKNAKTFYPPEAQEHRDADALWELYQRTVEKLSDSEETPEEKKPKLVLKMGRPPVKKAQSASPVDSEAESEAESSSAASHGPSSAGGEEVDNVCEELFSVVMNAAAPDGRLLHTAFQLLPSRRLYPDYYEVIENPIDLKQIAMKIQAGEYSGLSDMEKDLLLMLKNACAYNETGSQIYKDSKLLRKIVTARKSEIEHSRQSGGKTSERIRSKRARAVQSLSSITAALQYDDSMDGGIEGNSADVSRDDEDEGESAVRPDDADSSPFWQLYDAVHTFTDSAGNVLCEPFIKLPSRRRYPDYYKEIKNPISLSRIRAKMIREEYGNLSELAGDLSLMFENAKRYNRPDSKLFKDAVKLQRMMQTKVQELLADDDSSDGEVEQLVTPKRPKGRPRIHPLPVTPKLLTPKAENPLRKRLRQLYRCLMDYIQEDGRQPILVFMEKPSKKLYPDYYRVIAEPIDMVTVDSNIKNDRYTCEEELLDDLRLMFNNCRQYNEEGSIIYEDANHLERVLLDKAREMGLALAAAAKPKRRSRGPNLQQKLKALYEAVKEHRDVKSGRQLSAIFQKLPSKTEYPDYYEVIKKPIDLDKIGQKVKAATHYENLEELLADIARMCDNACRYNEPDSQIYKDALTLHQVALQTKVQLCEDEGNVPDVKAAVQELLTSLFAAVYNHQDEEGRCYTDSMAELPEHDGSEAEGSTTKKVRGISLDLIKRRLDKGLYRRLDAFQEDVFLCLERARKLSRTDSQVFEDSVELQAHFIKQRDEFCRSGDVLSSPALSYTLKDLNAAVDALRQEKLLSEKPEVEELQQLAGAAGASGSELMSFNQETYHVGDVVYVESTERNMENHVYVIERLWTAPDGQQMFSGNWFCRPNETYHLASRKFLEQELFKSEVRSAHPLSAIRGRCSILNVKEYFRMKPEGMPDKDVYVCESRYSTKARMFKKIKVWAGSLPATPDGVRLVPREVPLEPKRVVSVFRDRIEKHKEELAELGEVEKLPEKELVNVTEPNPPKEGSSTFFQQLNIPGHTLRTGDCVYVRAENGKQLIAQIDSMWTDAENVAYFHGPWYVTPTEISGQALALAGRVFYRQEVFLSSIEDTNPLMSVVGKCAVLDFNDYTTCRQTETSESDVYLCESLYEESRRQIRKLPRDGLKKYNHLPGVLRDEIYFFRRPIQPQRDASSVKMAGLNNDDLLTEDSMDGAPPSVGSDSYPATNATTPSSATQSTPTTATTKKIKIFQKRMVTGYIVYSGEERKNVAARNPDATFGEVSRLVGEQWRNLPTHVKTEYEDRAQRTNEETMAEMARNGELNTSATTAGEAGGVGDVVVFECCWKKCDWQGDEIGELSDHLLQEPNGHVLTTINPNDSEFQCMWRGCSRIRKGVQPFPKMERLLRHVREIHIVKNQGRVVSPAERSKNGAKKAAAVNKAGQSATAGSNVMTPTMSTSAPHFNAGYPPTPGQVMNVIAHPAYAPGTPVAVQQQQQQQQVQQRQPVGEPLFVAVPPRPQRLLHSEAYIKYIEGLHNQNRYLSNFDRSMRSTMETCHPDVNRLPSHWLGHSNVSSAGNNNKELLSTLWGLREAMLKDTLNVSKLFY